MVSHAGIISKLCLFQKQVTVSIPSRTMSNKVMEVIFEEKKNKGFITLNRPKAMNAFNMNMVRLMYPVLKQWENSKDFVVIKGAGDKAFCAGGDVVSIRDAGLSGNPLTKDFFKEEYQVNCLIGTYHIPYIALINGITMGGGVGLSVHGQFRVATEKTLFAMPETALGLFPDVGGTYFLPRLGGNLGMFLGLTGHRLKGRDTVKAGIATHFCDSEKIPELEAALENLKSPYPEHIIEVLTAFEERSTVDKDKEFTLKPYLPIINDCFTGESVEVLLDNLEKQGSEFAKKQINTIRKASPTSIKITYEALKRGANSTLQEALSTEYRLTQRCCEDNDFFEGVRSILVDKDREPHWKPASLEEVTQENVDRYFSPLTSTSELEF